MALVFFNKNRLETAVGWIFVSGFVLAVISLTAFTALYGLDRQDRFEVTIISINWLVLVINGILLGVVFKNQLKERSE
jgi:hypothetical protein